MSMSSAPIRSKVSWGPLAAILVTVSVFFSSQILGSVLLSLYPVMQNWTDQQATDWLNNSIVAQFSGVFLIEVITLALLFWFLKSRRAHPHDIGLKQPRLRDAGYAILGLFAYIASYIVVLQAATILFPGLDTNQRQELGFSTSISGDALVLVFVSLVVLPPIVEEILCRGFLYTGLRAKLGIATSAVITSIFFAAAHLQFGSGNALLWIAAIDTFVLSLVLVYLREKTDSLWASIGLHALKNGIAFTALFVLKVV
jgi:membrane protease YdiL (CAAX protease family)